MSGIDETRLMEVAWMLAPLRRHPRPDAALDTEAIRGEAVALGAEDEEGWVRARLLADGYEGWLPAAALASVGPAATHRVAVPRTLAFPGPDFKLPPIAALTLGASVRVVAREEARGIAYAVTDAREYLIARHLTPANETAADFVAVAESLLGTPYLWGGKSAMGLDCSGLTQLALAAAGIRAPRDSGPQERALGQALPPDTPLDQLKRGDLVFWKGHVAIARGDGTMIHANAHHMMVAIEGIAEGVARVAAKGDPVTTLKRL